MEKKTELTAADLALYLGCEIEVKYKSDGFRYYEHNGIYEITGNLINEYGRGETSMRPILRPLSDITEEEARALYRIDLGWEFEVFDWMGKKQALDYLQEADEAYTENIKLLIGNTEAWRYLLRQGFDLFGWIEAGLAIDKTKANQ